MKIFDAISKYGHEQVVFCHEQATGLRAVIAIHNTICGPALGGCRMWPFESEEEAIADAMRLSRGMTYKNAAAGLNLGGGKAVIIGDPNKGKSEALFRAFGRFVQSLGGRYITAEDVGTSVEDMEYIKMETDYVAGLPMQFGGSGDPSPFTALGTYEGIRASVKYHLKKDSLKGIRVAIQGVGHVGYYLCEMLHEAGAELIVTDIDSRSFKWNITVVSSSSEVNQKNLFDVGNNLNQFSFAINESFDQLNRFYYVKVNISDLSITKAAYFQFKILNLNPIIDTSSIDFSPSKVYREEECTVILDVSDVESSTSVEMTLEDPEGENKYYTLI